MKQPSHSRSAFTLVELLVVIAILAMLMALIMPSLNSALDRGRIAVCANHVRQHSLAYGLYAADHRQNLPWFVGTHPESPPWGGYSWQNPYYVGFQNLLAVYLGAPTGGPAGSNKQNVLFNPVRVSNVFVCPSGVGLPIWDGTRTAHTYVQNASWRLPYPYQSHLWPIAVARTTDFLRPSQAVLMHELWQRNYSHSLYAMPRSAHVTGRNVLYVDGHIEHLDPSHDDPPPPPNVAGHLKQTLRFVY